MSIDPGQFLEVARPALEAGDSDALAARVGRHWQPRQICELLCHEKCDVRRVAAVTLGLVGDDSCVGCLARALHDEDPQVPEMAEHGLWAIWFRGCTCEAARPFHEGVSLISDEAYQQAIDKFRQALSHDPDFAEAYNQAGMARFFLGQWHDSIAQCEKAVERQPCHFGALAGIGHCYTHLGDLHKALEYYRRAIAINPRMTAIADAVRRLENELESAPSTITPTPTIARPVTAFHDN